MDVGSSPLSILVKKNDLTTTKMDPDTATFLDYSEWMNNDFMIDAEFDSGGGVASANEEAISARPKLLQWGPQDGNDSTTVTALLERRKDDASDNSDAGAMKIMFGNLVLETASHVTDAPNNDAAHWVTLAAQVPPLRDVQAGSDGQLPVSICLYDATGLLANSWVIGAFSYLTSPIASQCERKRTVSPTLTDDYPQKRAYSTSTPNDDCQQLLQLLAPFDDPLSHDGASQQTTPNMSMLVSMPQQLEALRAQLYASPSHMYKVAQQASMYGAGSGGGGGGGGSNSGKMAYINTPGSMSSTSSMAISTPQHFQQQQHQQQQPHVQQPIVYHQPMASMHMSHQQQQQQQQQQQLPPHHPQHPSQQLQQQQQQQLQKAMPASYNGLVGHYVSSSPAAMPGNHVYSASGASTATNGYVPNHSASVPMNTSHITSNIPMNSIHPLAGVLNKANLKICGDLMAMTFNWTPYEWSCGRRLVRFWRRQNVSNMENSQQVECGFEPIDYYVHQQQMQQLQLQQSQRQQQQHQHQQLAHHAHDNPGVMPPQQQGQQLPSSQTSTSNAALDKNQTTYLVVSCIYWRERNDYFITSVDCIYLLEGLIGVQFTVEEKNRIRRNLEGFRPLTVSKCKADCADFFKLIMGFPHPKPRNIEKDVKVFAWKTLPHALRKIIRKYTPHYTSSNMPAAINTNPTTAPQPPQHVAITTPASACLPHPSPVHPHAMPYCASAPVTTSHQRQGDSMIVQQPQTLFYF